MYLREEIVPFSMPGHKNGRGFKGFEEILLKGDLTEVEGLDNLQHPEGIIKEAEDKLSKLYKSKKSYFLVNGSTCGNLIMIFSLDVYKRQGLTSGVPVVPPGAQLGS